MEIFGLIFFNLGMSFLTLKGTMGWLNLLFDFRGDCVELLEWNWLKVFQI